MFVLALLSNLFASLPFHLFKTGVNEGIQNGSARCQNRNRAEFAPKPRGLKIGTVQSVKCITQLLISKNK